jgi:uncharacterized protein
MRIENETRGSVLATHAAVANTSQTRRTGLLKHTSLPAGEGLYIVPCESVHCFFMKFTIDVVYVNKKKQVVKTVKQLKPWRISLCLLAHGVIELPAGTVDETGTRRGDQLVFIKDQD